MGVFKATKNRKEEGAASSGGTFKATNQRSYNSAMVYEWERANKESASTLQALTSKSQKNEYLSSYDLDTYSKALDNYIESSNSLRGITKSLGGALKDDDASWESTIASLKSSFDDTKEYWSRWKTEDAYKTAVTNYESKAKEIDALKNYDFDASKKEIDILERDLNSINYLEKQIAEINSENELLALAKAKGSKDAVVKMADNEKRIAILRSSLEDAYKQYNGKDALSSLISEKNALYNRAERYQRIGDLTSVADVNSANYDQNFSAYASSNNAFADDMIYKYINDIEGQRQRAEDAYGSGVSTVPSEGGASMVLLPKPEALNRNLKYLSEDEIALYNYYYNKQGKDAADEYIDLLQEDLNYRAAEEMFKSVEGDTGLEMIFGVAAGLDQFNTGIESLVSNKDYIPVSATQAYSSMVREDLADAGFTLPDWLGGSSVGQVAYDAITTTSNMLPSIMISAIPGVGSVAGAITLGASSAGHAKAEMLNLGYTRSQANWYGAMVGASEAGLQYLLGGITKLGGKASEGLTKLALEKVDNAIARVAITLGMGMASEGLEESLQTAIEPWLKSLATGVDFESASIDEVLYSGLLGAITSVLFEGASSVAEEVGTKELGSTFKESGAKNVTALANFGKQFADGTAANRLGNKVNENSSAYDIGRLLVESGSAVGEQNIADISSMLQRYGMSTVEANETAKWLIKAVDGGIFTKRQQKLLEDEPVVRVYQDLVGNTKNSVNQRNADYEALYELAREKSGATKTESEATKASTQGTETAQATENAPVKENATQGKFEASETGKTTHNGSEVKVESVASVKNGNVMVKLNDGNVVNANDVEFSTDEEARLYEAVRDEKMDADTANDFVSAYRAAANVLSSPQSVMDYRAGFVEAQTYGRLGIPFEALARDGQYTSGLIGKQAQIAYNRGKVIGINNANAAQNAPKKTSAKKITYKEEIHVSNIKKSQAYKGLSETQKAGVDGMVAVYKSLGIDVYFFESKFNRKGRRVGKNGYFNPKDNSIHVDLYAGNDGRGLILFTAAHELTHYIKKNSPAKFKAFADMLFEKYEADGHSVAERLAAKRAKLEQNGRLRGLSEQQIIDLAYEEVVADACEAMLAKGDAFAELSAQVKAKDKGLWEAIKDFFANLVARIKSAYKNLNPDSIEGNQVADMLETATELQKAWVEMLVEASSVDNITDVSTDPVAVEDAVKESFRSLAEAAGFEASEDENGNRSFIKNNKKVSEVTVGDIDNSPIGAFINYSLEKKDITEEQANAQKEMFAKVCTMACQTNDFSMSMQFVGSAVFTAMKANADKQYGTTYDFPSICTKTQAVIDAMSARMVKLGRGLSNDEIVGIYRDVFASGNPVPCPECYVFSRWIGIGGLLDNIKKYQEYYGKMSVKEVAKAYNEMYSKVADFAKEQNINFGKAKGALAAKLTKEYAKLSEKIAKQENQGEKVSESDRNRLAEIEPLMNTVKAMTWIESVYFADESLTKVNPNFVVPDSVLFDLNKGEEFASKYKEAWAFRTTQGAGYGKAITPYAEARLGEGVLVTNNTTNAIKGKAKGTLKNYFLQQNGQMDAQSKKALDRAREKQKNQAFIGGQRFQSTSDARYENASDYLIAALEMQAMHGMVQVYTKVDGAVAAFENWGFSTNQSLMPKGSGLDENGNVKDTSVGGMHPKLAYENRKKFEHAGTITIGVNDNHIRALFALAERDFIIPYHASGGKADVVSAFRTIQEGLEQRGQEIVRSTDYSRTQGDKVLSDEVLLWLGKTQDEVDRIHKIRDARIAILTRSKVDMDVVRSNRFLSALYDKLHGGEWDGVKLARGKVASQIFPNEFWDQTVSYEDSGQITKDYLEYCDDLGFLHRFSGLVPSNGMLVPVKGYNENGEKVVLTDLAYKYDENGNKTDTVEDFYWKTITDRRMYGNDGQYLPQKIVTLNDTTTETVTSFAKNNYGRQYDKEASQKTAEEVATKKYSDRDSSYMDAVNRGDMEAAQRMVDEAAAAGDFVSHMENLVKTKRHWYSKDVYQYVEEHPELNFIDRIFEGDKKVKKDLEAFLNDVDDIDTLENLSWYMGGGYSDKNYSWGEYPYRGAVRTFKNAVKKRINAIMTEKVGGTNLGIKNGEASIAEAKDIFNRLNSNEEIGKLAEKVFATAEKLGVNIRFVNQTFMKEVSGDALGDMVEYKTSYFNDTSISDQRKAQTILHELIHTCTIYVMYDDSKYNFMGDINRISGKSAEYVKLRNVGTRLNRIFNEIRNDPDFKGQYGTKNSMEMVAELSNENFVALLQKKTLWDRIIEAIAELFGFSRGNTAYDNAMQCLDYILDNPDIAEYKAHAKEQRKNARYNNYDVFGSTVLEDGQVNYSDRDTTAESASTRSILSNALESVAKEGEERNILRNYKTNVKMIEAEQAKLAKVKSDANALRFKKGRTAAETKQLEKLDAEAKAISTRINRYDSVLLKMEAMKPIKDILAREKQKAYKRASEAGRKAMEKQKARTEESRSRQAIKADIQRSVKKMTKLFKSNKKDAQANVKDEMRGTIASTLALADLLFANEISTVGAMINKLSIGYKALEKSEFDYISNAYSTVLQSRIDVLATNLGGKTVRDMNHSELAELRDVLKMIEHMIRESNKLFVEGRKADLAEILDDMHNEVIGASFARKELNPNADKVRNFVENFSWNNLRPVDAFARLGSQTFEQLFWDYIDGMGKAGVLVKEAGEVIANARKEYGYDKWDLSHVDKTYTTRDGYQFKPTLADKLSIYAYSQREQAMDHMVDGGFTFDTGADYTIEEKGKKKKLTRRKLSHTFRLTQEDIVKIISSLSNEQTAYVDAILPYLTSLGDKGNEVSLRLYGVKLFNEKVYFPLVSSKDYLNSTDQELGATKTMSSLVNWGAAKPTVPKANNSIVLRAFDDVVLEHIEQMSNYYGLTLPVENLRRVFDNVNRAEAGAMPVSTKALIGDRFGIEAQKYFAQLITDLNGGVMSSGARGPLETLFSRAKGMMVSSNLSVVAQQYFAVARAMELIDPKYFTPFLHGEAKKTDMKQYDEMIKYAPIAIIKEMGGFDVGSRGRVKDYIGYEGVNKKSAEYVKKTIDDVASWGASQMDKLGWVTIWKAVKAEVASEQSLTPGTEEFYAACKKRFTEIITKTQVFDSVASRSGYMRSKRDFTKMATSFMGEPTVTVGRLYVALNNLARDIRNGNKNGIKSSAMHLVRTTLSVSAATVLSSLAKALVYAGRDDEEDEALLERWTRNFGEALADDIFILNSLPYARDLMSLINGFDVERPDTTLLSDIISSVKRMRDGEITAEDSLGLIGSVGNLLGVPLKNLIREIKAAINVIGDLTDNVNPTNMGGAFVSGFTGNERNKSERLYDAVVYGDKQKIAVLTKGMTESEITSAIRSALRENDPRIAEAAMASLENNEAKRKSLTMEIEREKNFSSTIVRGAINNEIQYIKNKVNEAKRAKGTDKYDDIVQKLLDKYPQRFVDKILK